MISLFLVFALNLQAHVISESPATVLTSLDKARAVGGVILSSDEKSNLAVTYVTQLQLNQLSQLNHFQGKCAGFEALSENEINNPGKVLRDLSKANLRIKNLGMLNHFTLPWNEAYQKIADQADPIKLKELVTWLSSYPNRFNKAPSPNKHVDDLQAKLQQMLQGAKWNFRLDQITHKSTAQKSLRLTIPGKDNVSEVVVLGGHLDSINQSFFGGNLAPGADDNASGSSNLIEAVRLLKNVDQPSRTLEFYWYAGEESGLLGSAEIAKEAKAAEKNVIAVLQLDMTLYPGSGEQVIGTVTDYTSPWLRDILAAINSTYVKAKMLDDECGYACSDHASWHRQGYHAVTPFEAITQTMNHNIHSEKDLIDENSSFEHSNSFTKLAVLFALVLGNSDLRPPVN